MNNQGIRPVNDLWCLLILRNDVSNYDHQFFQTNEKHPYV